MYLDASSDDLVRLIGSSDVVCAWGKGSSLKSIKEKVPYGTPYLEFGPKRSFSVLFSDQCDLDRAAVRVAHDVSLYDQEACLSMQRLFVIGPHEEFIHRLREWLEWQAHALPKGGGNPDVESHLHRVVLEARYRGWRLIAGRLGWRIIVCDPFEVTEHPLSRTLFVHPIQAPEEVLPFIDEETQAISVYPYDHNVEKLGDLFCSRGVSKLCETGMSLYPREGWTHDGMHPLRHFVRLCYLDENMSYAYKYEVKEMSEWFLRTMYGSPSRSVEQFMALFPAED